MQLSSHTSMRWVLTNAVTQTMGSHNYLCLSFFTEVFNGHEDSHRKTIPMNVQQERTKQQDTQLLRNCKMSTSCVLECCDKNYSTEAMLFQRQELTSMTAVHIVRTIVMY